LGDILPHAAKDYADKIVLIFKEKTFTFRQLDDLSNYKVPRGVYFVDDVPKTSTGKIMRRKLADLLKPA
jgi:acyl-CoA synthetase (AMP-forming)/AMP-acid ligase II